MGGGVAAALSAQPEVDDFDGLFAVIVRRKREKERRRAGFSSGSP